MSAGSPDSAAQRNGPLPSQNSGRMYSGTKPGMSNAFVDAALHGLRADVVAVVERHRAARLQRRASRRRARPSRRSTARTYSFGFAAAERRGLVERHAVRHVAVQRDRAPRSGRSAGPARRRARPGPAARRPRWRTARRPRHAVAPPPRHPRQRVVEAVGGLVDVPRGQTALDAAAIHLDDQRRRAVHRRGQRLGPAHAAEAGRHEHAPRQRVRRSGAGPQTPASRRCPAGCPAMPM